MDVEIDKVVDEFIHQFEPLLVQSGFKVRYRVPINFEEDNPDYGMTWQLEYQTDPADPPKRAGIIVPFTMMVPADLAAKKALDLLTNGTTWRRSATKETSQWR